MEKRIRELRKILKLSQDAFGKQLGVTRFSILKYESGSRAMPDVLVKLTCQLYNVNYEWLTEGKGEMFIDNESLAMDNLAEKYDLNDEDRVIISMFLKMDKKGRAFLMKFLTSLTSEKTEE